MTRRYPSDIQENMTPDEINLTAIRDFFSAEWLSNKIETPVHSLWNDPSMVATLELYIYDQSLRAIQGISEAWLKDKRETIISHPDSRHVAGALAEFIFAGMFSLGGHKVQLAPRSMPVYDFTVEANSHKTPYISCKYVGAKDSELNFIADMKTFESEIKKIITPSHPVNVLIQIYDRKLTSKFSELLPSFAKVYGEYKVGPPGCMGVLGEQNKFFLSMNQLASLDTDVKFSENYSSYSFISAHQIHQNEQLKFNDIVTQADLSFGSLSVNEREQRFHMLTVLINPSLDFERAWQWAENEFASDRLKNLDSILISRIQPTQELVGNENFRNVVTTEYKIVVNQNRCTNDDIKEIFGSSGITLQVPIGKVSQSTTNVELRVNDKTINLDGHYLHISGEHYYKKDGLGEVNMTTYPYIKVYTDWQLNEGRVLLSPKDQNRSNFILI